MDEFLRPIPRHPLGKIYKNKKNRLTSDGFLVAEAGLEPTASGL